MAASTRYSEADRRGRNSNQDVTHIGVAGRRTGLRVEGARRGSDGFENESAFFSPTTTAKKANREGGNLLSSARSVVKHGSGSYQDMDLEESSAQDVVSALKRRGGSEGPRSPLKSATRRATSPTKTHLNSPALRVRSASAKPVSPPKSALRSPSRPAVTGNVASKVARKLDFSRADPGRQDDLEGDVLATPPKGRLTGRSSNVKGPLKRTEDAQPIATSDVGIDGDEMAGADVTIGSDLPDVVLENAQDEVSAFPNAPMDDVDPPFDEYLHDEVEDAPQQEEAEDAPQESTPVKKAASKRGRRTTKDDILPNGTEEHPQIADAGIIITTKSTGKKQNARSAPEASEDEPPKKRGRPKGARNKRETTPRATSQSRDRQERMTRTASPQRRWVEPISQHGGPDEDVNGVRKSSRFKIAPLAFWRGEKLVYGRGPRRKSVGGTVGLALPEVKEVIHVEPAHQRLVRKKNRRRRIKRESSVDAESSAASSSSEDEEGWEEQIVVEAPVPSYEDESVLVKRLLAIPESAYEPRSVVGQGILFQKTLAEEPHFAAGILDIPVGHAKPSKPSRMNTMFFFIYRGYVEVKIHDVVLRLRRGAQFTIPRGNSYEIHNVGRKDARLVFSQSTDTLANHRATKEEARQS